MLKKFNLVETKAKTISVGDVFGRLSVLAVGQVPGTYRYFAVCKCSCGSQAKAVRSDSLVMGKVESCGCIQRERSTTHGMTASGQYGRWRHMMSRCYNEGDNSYKDYGGRGITVCDRWHQVENFVEDMAPSYIEGLEIDRRDNDGNYEPSNCRWVTRADNANNRRTGHMLTHNGITQSLTDWSKQTGIGIGTLSERVNVLGWNAERAVTEPVNDRVENMRNAQKARWAGHKKAPKKATNPKPLRLVTLDGKSLSIAELHAMTGIPKALLRKRIFERGWSVEKAIADRGDYDDSSRRWNGKV